MSCVVLRLYFLYSEHEFMIPRYGVYIFVSYSLLLANTAENSEHPYVKQGSSVERTERASSVSSHFV